ncbi:MAG TPA: methionine--tRNA ligase [Candidatus Paceibacterota bacterium]
MTIDDFQKIDLRVAKILEAERIDVSEKLIKLKVTLGAEERQIIAGIGKVYEPAMLIGKEIIVVANLEPRTFTLRQDSGQVGLESQGMLLAASNEDGSPVLLIPEKEIQPGTKVR